MLVECNECRGIGEACYSCCTGEVITGDILMCPDCHEHLGYEQCQGCGGVGKIEEEDNLPIHKVDLLLRAEYASDAKQDR